MKFLRDLGFRMATQGAQYGSLRADHEWLRARASHECGFPGREWIATLMDCSGCSLDYVEWHHQEEMVPPQAMLTAAGLLLAKAEVDRDGGTL